MRGGDAGVLPDRQIRTGRDAPNHDRLASAKPDEQPRCLETRRVSEWAGLNHDDHPHRRQRHSAWRRGWPFRRCGFAAFLLNTVRFKLCDRIRRFGRLAGGDEGLAAAQDADAKHRRTCLDTIAV